MEQLIILDLSFDYNGILQTIHPVLLQDEHHLLMVDCGYPGFLPLIEKKAREKSIDLNMLTGIIITHNDIDHNGGLFEVKEKYPHAMVYASVKEAPAVSGKEKSARLLQAEALFPTLPAEHQPGARAFQQMLEAIRPVPVDHILQDDAILTFCGGISIIPTPGHTPGHISLYLKKSKTLITGDVVVIENGILNIANPQFAIDLAQAVASVKKLQYYDIEKLVCYHGGILTENIQGQITYLLQKYQ